MPNRQGFERSMTEKLGTKTWKPGAFRRTERCTCAPTCTFTWVIMDLYYRCPYCNTINEALDRQVGPGLDGVCEKCFHCSYHIEDRFNGLGQAAEDYVKEQAAKQPVEVDSKPSPG